MRIKITVAVDRQYDFSKSYNEGLTAFIYKMISLSDSTYGCMLHEKGFNSSNKKFKFFTFSKMMSENRLIIDKTFLPGMISFLISSPIEEIGNNFIKGISIDNDFQLYGVKIPIVKIDLIEDNSTFKNGGLFKTISPFIVKSDYDPIDKEYLSELIINNLIEKFYVLYEKMPEKLNMELRILNVEKIEITYKSNRYIAYNARMAMSSNEELIRTAYLVGIGSKNSQGYGMIELI